MEEDKITDKIQKNNDVPDIITIDKPSSRNDKDLIIKM